MTDQALTELGAYVANELGDDILTAEVRLGELTLTVRRESIVNVLTFLRDDTRCLFRELMDVCGVDWPSKEERLEVVYNLLSLTHNRRVRVKLSTRDGIPVPSATGVHSGAGWFERETWDMFGVLFAGHSDLRRILTD